MTNSTMIETPTNTDTICGAKVAWDAITDPGCYVSNATGHLLRVSNDFNADTFKTWMSCEGNVPNVWTCVSNDPNCAIDDCRVNAANCDVDCSF